MLHILHKSTRAQNCIEILHIASVAAHTTLNTYTPPMGVSIERSTQHWCPSEVTNSEVFVNENDVLTARQQLHGVQYMKYFSTVLKRELYRQHDIWVWSQVWSGLYIMQ